MFIIRKIWYILTLPLLVLTLITSPVASSTETAELVSKNTFVFEKALLMGQGITTDGEYYYTSGALAAIDLTALAKFTFDDMELVDTHVNPLPDKCTDRKDDHIGGISYYNGKIYASVEDSDDYLAPCIVVLTVKPLKQRVKYMIYPLRIMMTVCPGVQLMLKKAGFMLQSGTTSTLSMLMT